MSRVKVGISRLTALELVSKAQYIVGQMTDNPNFTTPNPSLADITTAADQLFATANEAESGEHLLISLRNQEYTALADLLRLLAAYVQNASNGDSVLIETSGFEVVQRGEPIGQLSAPGNFKATIKVGISGQIFLDWDRVRGANSYIVKMTTTDPNDPQTVWEQVGFPQQSRLTVTALTPGVVYWFMVTPNGAAGLGASTSAISLRSI